MVEKRKYKYYEVKGAIIVNGFLILDVVYPDCNNYEGRKILMFDKGVTLSDLMNQRGIDPHFSNSKTTIHPIARFEPTERGARMAEVVAESYSKWVDGWWKVAE